MYHLLTAIWNIITHNDDSECFQVSCYWHFPVEAMPQTTSAHPRKGSFLPRAWLTCVLSSKVRESSRKPVQMAPGSLQSCMKLVPRAVSVYPYTHSHPGDTCGTWVDGLCVAFFSFLNFLWVFILWGENQIINQETDKTVILSPSCGRSPPQMAVRRPQPWWEVSCEVFQVDMIHAGSFFLTVL